MDKLSAALISAICMLLCISTGVIYSTWFKDGGKVTAASTVEQIHQEMELSNIAMNQEAQVINGGGADMWIRVKAETGESDNLQAAGCELVSYTIKTDPTQKDLEKGVWILDDDGYYYYSKTVSPGEQSRSLFQSAISENKESSSIKVKAEAVQVNWIAKKAGSSQEAFRLFSIFKPLEDDKSSFV